MESEFPIVLPRASFRISFPQGGSGGGNGNGNGNALKAIAFHFYDPDRARLGVTRNAAAGYSPPGRALSGRVNARSTKNPVTYFFRCAILAVPPPAAFAAFARVLKRARQATSAPRDYTRLIAYVCTYAHALFLSGLKIASRRCRCVLTGCRSRRKFAGVKFSHRLRSRDRT